MPTLLQTLLAHAAQDLANAQADYAVIGGLAAAARAMLRTVLRNIAKTLLLLEND